MTAMKPALPGLSVFVVALVSAVLAIIFFFRLDVWMGDYFITAQSNWPDPQNLVLVTVTEDSLATLKYRSPIDRKFLADIIGHIDDAGARAIGVDILIDQVSEPQKDAALQNKLENAKAAVVIGYAGKAETLTQKQVDHLDSWTQNLSRGLVTLERDDFDGVIRQVYSGRSVGDSFQPGLATALANKIGVANSDLSGRISYFSNSKGMPFEFPTYPAHTVGLIPADWFKDKIVLIGSALPTADLHQTPFSTTNGALAGSLYGIAIHAHMLTQILNDQRVKELGAVQSALLVLGTALAAGFITIIAIRPVFRLVVLIALLTILTLVWLLLYQHSQILVPFVAPAGAAILTTAMLAFREWQRDRKGRRFVEEAFSKYVSPAVVRRIIARREDLKLGGEVRRVTYVFTDLQGFTTMCEGLEPEQVAVLLNDYLDRMCTLFVDHDATIDKIIGDAVVGFFGAPERQDDQCQRAVELALAIDRFAEQFKAEKQAEGYDLGSTRIGVHCGDAVVGNFGGKRFIDYTGIGDTVNSAARMEAANKLFGTRICVSDAVRQECAKFTFRTIGEIVLRGKNQELTCYEPLHPNDHSNVQIEAYDAAYCAMVDGDKTALAKFSKLAESNPDDPLVSFHHHRLLSGETGSKIAA